MTYDNWKSTEPESGYMNTELDDLCIEYDALLLKKGKTESDHKRIREIEIGCWSRFGFRINADCN